MKTSYAAVGTECRRKHGEARRVAAQKIINHPENYAVCDLCWAIVTQHQCVCPLCGAYRFDRGPERVILTALAAGSRDLAVTDAYYPRMQCAESSNKI